MILTEEPRYWFYPDVAGNLSQPESEQLAVEIIRPTGYQRAEFTRVEVDRDYYPDDQPLDAEGNERKVARLKHTSVRTTFDADYILRNCVGAVKNLSVETAGADGKKATRGIKTGAELAECRAYGIEKIVTAVCMEIQRDAVSDAKKKITA